MPTIKLKKRIVSASLMSTGPLGAGIDAGGLFKDFMRRLIKVKFTSVAVTPGPVICCDRKQSYTQSKLDNLPEHSSLDTLLPLLHAG
jgi:hypothetical protein